MKDNELKSADKLGYTALHLAAMSGEAAKVEDLLQRGADPNVKNLLNHTPLHCAALLGHTPVIIALLKHDKINPNPMDTSEQTPLHSAAMAGQFNAVEALLEDPRTNKGAIDYDGNTALHLAVWHGKDQNTVLKVLEVLLGHGATVDLKNLSGLTSLHFAAESDNPETLRVLLAKGAKVDSKSADGSTPLHRATEKKGQAKAVKLLAVQILLDNGANVHAKNNLGKTPLELCTDDETRTILLEAAARQKIPPPLSFPYSPTPAESPANPQRQRDSFYPCGFL